MVEGGWDALFRAAFRQSRNAMLLVDDTRLVVDVNGAFLQLVGYRRDALVRRPVYEIIAGGPLVTTQQWAAELAAGEFAGEIGLIRADGSVVVHQWGATVEVVTGRRLVLAVALRTSRWGDRFRRELDDRSQGELSEREREVVHLVALGRSGPEIADDLGVAHNTVRTHVRNAMQKIGARSRAHLVAKALGEGHAFQPR